MKRSDLKALFGRPSQKDPIYLHTVKRRNKRVGSLDATALKSSARLCAFCNNELTQPHDRAWEYASSWLQSRMETAKQGDSFRGNSLFPYNTRKYVRDLHLYWVKIFGCAILESQEPIAIDIAPFARAIRDRKVMPDLYIAFGPMPMGRAIVAATDMETVMRDKVCVIAIRVHTIGNLGVLLVYSADGEEPELKGMWNPATRPVKRFLLKDFEEQHP